jgi:hypothetical protein
MDIGTERIKYPFKFNQGWLHEESFVEIIREVWLDNRFNLIVEAQRRLTENLSLLKSKVKSWSLAKQAKDKESMTRLEVELESMYI